MPFVRGAEAKALALSRDVVTVEQMAETFEIGQVVYVTKYALTKGILTKRVASLQSEDDPRWNSIMVEGDRYSYYYPARREVHATTEAAQAEVQAMAERKLSSLNKQIAKVSKMALNGVKIVALPEEKAK